ncbi:MAG: phenylalanine--tRNA ligase beta subunit-related protein [Pontimonas sp.]
MAIYRRRVVMAKDAASFLSSTHVSDEVFTLRPDYRADLIVATGLRAHTDTAGLSEWVAHAEEHARKLLTTTAVAEVGHIASWREAFRAFGAKPSEYRNSAEALLRRAFTGLPRINALTDMYNALSVFYVAPVGGENLDAYRGPARLSRAEGNEPFDTVSDGEDVISSPLAGEVVWRDDVGVTCRRWNWRQCRRTRLTEHTTNALFIIDTLDPLLADQRNLVADDLITWLERFGAEDIARRTLARELTP